MVAERGSLQPRRQGKMDKIPISSIPQLTATNYYIWAMKLEAALGLRKIKYVLTKARPQTDKEREKWDSDNEDAVYYKANPI